MEGYRITELARRFGLARSTLLHYDRIGVLPPGGRTAVGYRVYTSGDLARLERICALREAGLGLADIARLLDGAEEESGILERRLRGIGREVASLRSQQRVLAAMLRTSSAGPEAAGLDRLERDAAREGLDIETRELSIIDMPFEEGSFDLLWSEGSIFIPGLERGLEDLMVLLAPGGSLAFTEMCLFRDDPAAELRDWFDGVYPGVKTVQEVRDLAQGVGFEPVGDFRLPDSAWWDDYYTPMLERMEVLEVRNAGVAEAQEIYARCRLEAEMFRKHSASYGYAFFVLRKGNAR
jgi:DNA-binding transcriptional MerR regulator